MAYSVPPVLPYIHEEVSKPYPMILYIMIEILFSFHTIYNKSYEKHKVSFNVHYLRLYCNDSMARSSYVNLSDVLAMLVMLVLQLGGSVVMLCRMYSTMVSSIL